VVDVPKAVRIKAAAVGLDAFELRSSVVPM
jgi:hypothetical protein